MSNLTFTSKDKVLDEYYQECFSSQFAREFAMVRPRVDTDQQVVDAMIDVWRQRMLRQARIQEHYDYTIDKNGRRQVVRDEHDQPVLLIPEVAVAHE